MKNKSNNASSKNVGLDPATSDTAVDDMANNKAKLSQEDDKNTVALDLAKENQDLVNHLQKLQAEFDNYRKREDDTRTRLLDMAKENALIEILPILDNIDRASNSIPDDIKDNSWVKGIEFISTQISQTMNKIGIERFISLGEMFDPHKHEAIEEIDSDQVAGTIVKEVNAGYRIGSRIVRPASVVIASKTIKE